MKNVNSRDLDWPKCLNVRDVGDHPAAGGRKIQPGRLVRSDTLGRLNAAGRQALLGYGIRTIIDLRRPNEVAAESHDFVHGQGPVRYLNIPLEKFYPHVSAKIVQAKSRGEVYCIILDHYPDLIAEALQAFGTAVPGGVLIHCRSGKDRTGMITALALRLAHVPPELLIADYARSQERLLQATDSTSLTENDKDPEDFWNRPTALPEMMAMMITHIDETYGSVRDYLLKAGLSNTDCDRISRRLLDS